MMGGDMDAETKQSVTDVLNTYADHVEGLLNQSGISKFSSPIFRPWSITVVRDANKVLVAFGPIHGGSSSQQWLDRPNENYAPEALSKFVVEVQGQEVSLLLVLPLPGSPSLDSALQQLAVEHLAQIERANTLGKLGDLSGLTHLEPHLRQFLAAYPNPDRNVFVMMRFLKSDQLDEAFQTIRETLRARGFNAVRADDRDYTGELWANIEVYLTCCKYGIAVFEDIEKRDFNPNVSLELGYMLGRQKRCLILKEQRLAELPADVVHRLYKPFDMFDIAASVGREVGRWIDVDLGHTSA